MVNSQLRELCLEYHLDYVGYKFRECKSMNY